MGRINISYFLHIIRKRLLGFLPYKYRKPFILLFSIIGLYTYFNFMIVLSKMIFGVPSEYLLLLKKVIIDIFRIITEASSKQMVITFFVLLLVVTIYKYCVTDEMDNENNKKDKRKYDHKKRSWYYQVNTLISLGYIVVTILTFLPFIGGV